MENISKEQVKLPARQIVKVRKFNKTNYIRYPGEFFNLMGAPIDVRIEAISDKKIVRLVIEKVI